jgi:hypothetical protein
MVGAVAVPPSLMCGMGQGARTEPGDGCWLRLLGPDFIRTIGMRLLSAEDFSVAAAMLAREGTDDESWSASDQSDVEDYADCDEEQDAPSTSIS